MNAPVTYPQNRLVFLTHALVWSVLILIPIITLQANLQKELDPRYYIMVFSVLGSLALVFYVNYLFLAPRLLLRRKTLWYILAVFALLIFMFYFSSIVRNLINMRELFYKEFGYYPYQNSPSPEMAMPIFSGLLSVAVGTALRAIEHSRMHERMGDVIRESKLNAELAFLKNQISPHFFFNTLNTIYALTGSDPQAARTALHKLSKLMRYLLYETEKPLTTVKEEIDFLQDYIELMKMRLPAHVSLQFDHQTKDQFAKMPPMLLIPLVENAFKHGVSNQKACELHFSLSSDADKILFRTHNPLHPHHQRHKEPGGVGLSNMKRRLDILYSPESYELEIHKEPDTFSVTLSIPTYAN